MTRLLAHDNTHAPPAVQTYLQDLAAAKARYDKHVYPGSPWFIAHHAEKYPEPAIRAEAFERHADEYDALNYQLHQLPIGIHHRNAYEGVLAVVPPQEKRGLVLLDPPFEQEHRDFSSLVELLVKAHGKWATGVFALWYPLKNSDAVSLFYKKCSAPPFAANWCLSCTPIRLMYRWGLMAAVCWSSIRRGNLTSTRHKFWTTCSQSYSIPTVHQLPKTRAYKCVGWLVNSFTGQQIYLD
ncbi:23S rRNA (adenine(2030)-N(6))-methyltransferase RlmJ [Faucicola atlantae]|uniref:23S rRNA (adenine(2030)-N(6))-methyltransferase RlmJ n=1 Tax=Faucicola atlantae TaxID=34059 RepID=UPI003EC0EDD1